ncbi:MAG TPA: TIGR03435 family protein [Terracidiphilus sp.]|jgi:uncharacterized protein (TIGR03435 family)
MSLIQTIVALVVVISAIGAASQAAPSTPPATPKTYEVVSIKPTDPGVRGASVQGLPDGFRDINMRIEIFVEGAYDMPNGDHTVGMPSWAKSQGYDIEAKVDAGTAEAWKSLSNKERWKQEQPLMQAMLADRCKLKVHFETKEMPAYNLVIAKGGLKMKEAALDEKTTESMRDGDLTVRAMPIENLIYAIPSDGRLIIDKTGLGDKKFDFDLKWTPENRRVDGDSGPSLFTALEEQLGLKLVPSKAPGKILVIDHIEKPSPN